MDNLNREQATILCNIVKYDLDTPAVRKRRITKFTKRVPTADELERVRERKEFANYFHVVDSSYTPRLNDGKQISANVAALLSMGCTKAQADEFASREFKALPKWLRDRIKRSLKSKQDEPRKLKPQPGELAFYINPHRFPPMKAQPIAVSQVLR